MFEENQDQSNQVGARPGQPQQQPVEDIFADNDQLSVVRPGTNKSVGGNNPMLNEQSNIPQPINDLGGKDRNWAKNILMIFLILVVLGGLGYGGWWAYGKFIKDKLKKTNSEGPNINTVLQNLNQNINKSIDNQNKNTNSNPPINNNPPPVVVPPTPVDSDQDGLTDDEERKLGMDESSKDSDIDQLDDYQEVKIYKTDPLNRDSDGDGYSDGEEVKNGYNPLGTGKLP